MQRASPRHWWRIRPWRPTPPFYGSAGAPHSRRPSRRNSPPLTLSPFRADFVPLTLPPPPVGERVAQGRRGAAEPYPELGEGERRSERSPHPALSPQWGRGLRRVGEAQPSPTRNWVRGTGDLNG